MVLHLLSRPDCPLTDTLSLSDPHEPFQLMSPTGPCLSSPLRSRLKIETDLDSPIKGWRVVVKDNIDLSGVVSTVGNRAFGELSPPRSTTAESIQKVINRGVVVVGKTKMTSFSNWEKPVECIDYQAPWNPRGDGCQSPGGSSSGSAAAIAA
jgi:Asp-tRNA(Asn)/Glu-tRNA(Gln) amidotransferase A subunit family amidase